MLRSLFFLILFGFFINGNTEVNQARADPALVPLVKLLSDAYQDISQDAIVQALGVLKASQYGFSKKNVITIIDFSKPSYKPRMHVISVTNSSESDLAKITDLKNIVRKTYLVSHGKMSGGQYPETFSNAPGTNKSSLGVYRTLFRYRGVHDEKEWKKLYPQKGNETIYSMLLEGLEKGINDQAYSRFIVMHGANYVPSVEEAQESKWVGRSQGCPAVAFDFINEIIDQIEGGSLLYIYSHLRAEPPAGI